LPRSSAYWEQKLSHLCQRFLGKKDCEMITLASAFLAICLVGASPQVPGKAISLADTAPPMGQKLYVKRPLSAMSAERRAVLLKTIAKRREYRLRFRGNADRQYEAVSPLMDEANDRTIMMIATSGY
jgi:hypothetical protein